MKATTNPEHHRPRRATLGEILVLAAIVTALTIGASSAYPIWDDRRLLLLIETNGIQAIDASFGIRPAIAFLFTFLSNHQLFFATSLVFHWLGWLGIGLATMRLWQVMFPEQRQVALLPALLSVAPILCKIHLVMFTVVFIALSATLLGYIGLFFLISDETSRGRKTLFAITGIALMAVSTIISEYGTLTAIVGVILLMAKGMRSGKSRRKEAFLVAGILAATTLLFYFIFLAIGSRSNPGFLPSYSLQFLSWKIGVIPFRLLSGLWRGVLGGVLESIGSITVSSKIGVLSFAGGVVVSAFVVRLIGKRYDPPAELRHNAFSLVTLLVAVIVVLIPILLMDRTLESRWDSRFYLPLLPVLSSLTVFALLSLLRRRLWFVVAIVCGILAGYWTGVEIAWTMRNRETVRNERLGKPPPVSLSVIARNHRPH